MSGPTQEEVEDLLDQAEAALDQGALMTALQLCARAHRLMPGHPGVNFVQADTLRALGDLPAAADAYRAAALGRPDHASSWASLGLVSYELLQMDDADRAASRAIREDPNNPEGWWVRSLVREWRGDLEGCHRALARARYLDPRGYPIPPRLTDEEIGDLVDIALGQLPPDLRNCLSNVAILLEDMPSEEVLKSYDPSASPIELLGYFSGQSLMERSFDDPWSMLPPTIVLFRRNLERQARDKPELVEQLRITLFHEIGHYLGLTEADLADRGLE